MRLQAGGELDGIGENVAHDLLEPQRVDLGHQRRIAQLCRHG